MPMYRKNVSEKSSCSPRIVDKRLRRILWIIISAVLTIGLLYYVLTLVDWSELKMRFREISIGWLLIAAMAMTGLQLVGAIRLKLLANFLGTLGEIRFISFLEVTYWHQLLVRVLPLRLGEFAFLWLAKRKLGIAIQRNLGLYTILRLWDLRIVVASFIICGGYLVFRQNEWAAPLIYAACATAILLFFLSAKRVFSIALFAGQVIAKPLRIKQWLSPVLKWLEAVVVELEKVRIEYRWSTVIMSISNWIISFCVIWGLLVCLESDVSAVTAVALSSGLALVSIVPIHTIGGIGIYEAGQTVILMVAGFNTNDAAGISIGLSALHLGLSIAVPLLMAAALSVVKFYIAACPSE